MSSDFEKNSIRMSEVPSTKVAPPDTSKDIKLFQEKGKLYTKDFAGNVAPVTPEQQEIKVAQVAVNTNEDANEFILRIPSPNAKLQALESSLKALVSSTSEDFAAKVEEAKAEINSWRISQEAANGIFDNSISEIEQKVSEILSGLEGKTDKNDFTSLQSDLATIVTNINRQLASMATAKQLDSNIREVKASIPQPIEVVSGSDNVKVTKQDNTYKVSVDMPEVTREIIREVGKGGGGISQKKVIELIQQYGGGGGNYSVTLSVSPSTVEIGSTANPVTVSWSYGGGFIPAIELLNGNPSVSPSNFPNVSTNTSYTIVSTNVASQEVTDTASITFGFLRYYGGYATDSAIDEANIKLLSSELVFTKQKEFTVDCTGGKRVVFAYPKSYGLATVRDGNGFLFNDFYGGTNPAEVTITNDNAQSTVYYVYQTYNKYFSSSITFSFA